MFKTEKCKQVAFYLLTWINFIPLPPSKVIAVGLTFLNSVMTVEMVDGSRSSLFVQVNQEPTVVLCFKAAVHSPNSSITSIYPPAIDILPLQFKQIVDFCGKGNVDRRSEECRYMVTI